MERDDGVGDLLDALSLGSDTNRLLDAADVPVDADRRARTPIRVQPIEVRSLGRTLSRWRLQIAAWHTFHVSNGPTEAANNLIKRVKRAAFGFTNFANYRIRSLLYAGKRDRSQIGVVTPR
jgi:hypothetical protein